MTKTFEPVQWTKRRAVGEIDELPSVSPTRDGYSIYPRSLFVTYTLTKHSILRVNGGGVVGPEEW